MLYTADIFKTIFASQTFPSALNRQGTKYCDCYWFTERVASFIKCYLKTCFRYRAESNASCIRLLLQWVRPCKCVQVQSGSGPREDLLVFKVFLFIQMKLNSFLLALFVMKWGNRECQMSRRRYTRASGRISTIFFFKQRQNYNTHQPLRATYLTNYSHLCLITTC